MDHKHAFLRYFCFLHVDFNHGDFFLFHPERYTQQKTQNKSTLSESVGGCTVEHVAIHSFTLALNFNTLLEGTNETNIFQTKPGICQNQNWHERAAFQRSVFGRSTAGNDVVATIFIILFLFYFYFFPPLLLRRNLLS